MICSKCKQDLAENCFSSRGGGKLHKQCKNCKHAAIKAHYEKNKPDYIARAKKKNRERKKTYSEYVNKLKSVPCTDCKICYPPYVMDFDHVKGEKLFNIGDARSRLFSFQGLVEEIEKCEVVCSNCHRIRTYNRTKCI